MALLSQYRKLVLQWPRRLFSLPDGGKVCPVLGCSSEPWPWATRAALPLRRAARSQQQSHVKMKHAWHDLVTHGWMTHLLSHLTDVAMSACGLKNGIFGWISKDEG